jgi:hypothetical protein
LVDDGSIISSQQQHQSKTHAHMGGGGINKENEEKAIGQGAMEIG